MSGIVTAVVGTAVVGGIVQSKAAGKAAAATRDGNNSAIAEQRAAREQAREDLNPFREMGEGMIPQIQELMGSTGVDNQLFTALNDRSLPQLSQSSAANGLFNSGGNRQQLTDRMFDNFLIAGPQLQQQKYNQMLNLVNMGQSSAAGQANAAMSSGANIGNLMQSTGQSQAQGAINQGNAIGGAINNIGSAFGGFGGFGGGDFQGAVRPMNGGQEMAGPFNANGRF